MPKELTSRPPAAKQLPSYGSDSDSDPTPMATPAEPHMQMQPHKWPALGLPMNSTHCCATKAGSRRTMRDRQIPCKQAALLLRILYIFLQILLTRIFYLSCKLLCCVYLISADMFPCCVYLISADMFPC